MKPGELGDDNANIAYDAVPNKLPVNEPVNEPVLYDDVNVLNELVCKNPNALICALLDTISFGLFAILSQVV